HVEAGQVERLGFRHPPPISLDEACAHGMLELYLDVDDLPGLDGLPAQELRDADDRRPDLVLAAVTRGKRAGTASATGGHANLTEGRPLPATAALGADPHGRKPVVEASLA